MANQTISLKSQPIRVFGPSTAETWGAFNWGASNSLTPWGYKAVGRGNLPPLNVALIRIAISITITNSISSSFNRSVGRKYTGNGYAYVFVDGTTNAESSVAGSFTTGSGQSTTYTTASVSSTWSRT